ncbi:MAG: methylated-DNA--[protein]-cysteine S-methyltransferase [Bacteroidales bacterium]
MSTLAAFLSPIGQIKITTAKNAITSLTITDELENIPPTNNPLLCECIKQLEEYFEHKRRLFNLPIQLEGTEFQKKAWRELLKIPYAETINYSQQALSLGNENLKRAVGKANSKNQHWIIVPCHRVVGKNNEMIGYAGAIWRKKWLLLHEQNFIKQSNLLSV